MSTQRQKPIDCCGRVAPRVFVNRNCGIRVNFTTCAGRGVSLEQRTHTTVMFQSHFSYLALGSQRLRTPLVAPPLATLLKGTGPLRSLRKACASLFALSPTPESGLIRPVEKTDGNRDLCGPRHPLLELACFDIELSGAATVEIQ